MKRFYTALVFVLLVLGQFVIFAQAEDDVPYLSDADIAAMEIILPEDTPDRVAETPRKEDGNAGQDTTRNEIASFNGSQPLYHLLILDRARCPANSDISSINDSSLLYKLKHGKNGYLIAIYISPKEGPVFPVFPNNSRIILNLMTNRLSTIREYINSAAFRKFVTSRIILTQIQEVL